MSITVYGIKNCNTMKKTFDWLESKGMKYDFHNYKTEGVTQEKIEKWLSQEKPEILVNNRGTTFRNFSEDQKANFTNPEIAQEMMLANQSVIKRPIIEKDGKVVAVGFKPEYLEKVL